MSPVPVAAARNISTVTESETVMTDEELQETIKEISESLGKLSNSDDQLTKEERRRKQVLLLKREALEIIKEARKKNDRNRELMSRLNYALLTSFGEKHPYLLYLVKSQIRWSVF